MNALIERYELDRGVTVLSGIQAIVRLLSMQRERDRRAGLRTAGFVSGYRGSPLGGLDMALWSARDVLAKADVEFRPGLNEDLAATAVWGTQQLGFVPHPKVDGVFSLWYGKGPGVDRSGDALKHGNYAGAMSRGGVMVLVGDDHAAKSSTLAHQSEQALVAAQIPIIYPASVQDIIDLGLHVWAMSRYSNLWVGFKLVNETAETTATVSIDPERIRIVDRPGGSSIQPGTAFSPLADDIDLVRRRMPLVHAYVRLNKLDRRTFGRAGARLGIVAAGKAYADVIDALAILGISSASASEIGLSVYKVGLVWPLEPHGLREFADGCDELLFVEEKRAFMEDQAGRLLYNLTNRPAISGKLDPSGHMSLLPADEPLTSQIVAEALAARMRALGITAVSRKPGGFAAQLAQSARQIEKRAPYFCSGCPHSQSTRLPAGSAAFAGIGCHGMAQWMDRATVKGSHMGGEGANWIGLAPFTGTRHVFQNMGDGTFAHSGLLAIRAAVHAKANITYKILVNGAVAMTGGQPVEGAIGTPQIVDQVLAERVAKCVIVSDDHARIRSRMTQVEVYPIDQLEAVQRMLRDTPGATVLVFEKACATELRRRRKRSAATKPAVRVIINEDVCEGCGDCSVQSNCVSILPKDTLFGRKREIDQAACNHDLACVAGFCPSFVTVAGRILDKTADEILDQRCTQLPLVETHGASRAANILVAGIGGAGVVTVGTILAAAAHIEGRRATSFNMSGLAQKGGAVLSHIRIPAFGEDCSGVRLIPGEADLVLGGDLLTTASSEALHTFAPDRTKIVVDASPRPTAAFHRDADHQIPAQAIRDELARLAQEVRSIDATGIVRAALGDTLATNMFLVGFAYQTGWLPLSLDALRRAIDLNGVSVTLNLRALDLGRLAAHEPSAIAHLTPSNLDPTLAGIVEHGVAHLTLYQSAAWADRYRRTIRQVIEREQAIMPGHDQLARKAAQNLARLMSYKDEYEVARLYSTDKWRSMVDLTFGANARISIHLAPPIFTRIDRNTGRPMKRAFGAWVFPLFRVLARCKGLRGTPFDPFGRSDERRAERALIERYEHTLQEIVRRLSEANYSAALALADMPAGIRGFGPVKEEVRRKIDPVWESQLGRFLEANPL
jgi:indolepyruvate ferredoxin oxidoreductase